MDGLTKAVSGGIYSPNEARRKEGMPAVEHGDEPRLQAQVVPLSAAAALPSPSSPAAPAAPATPPATAPERALTYDAAGAKTRLLERMRILADAG